MARNIEVNSLDVQDGVNFSSNLIDDGGGIVNKIKMENAEYKDGGNITHENILGRPIKLRITIKGTTEAILQDNLATLQGVLERCRSPFFGKLRVEDHDGVYRIIDKLVYEKIDRDYTHYNNNYVTYTITFKSERARWWSETETSVIVSPTTGLYEGTLTVTGEGNIEPLLKFVFTTASSTDKLIYRNLTTNQFFEIDYPLGFSNGDLLEIDCRENIVRLNGSHIVVNFSGVFPEFVQGVNDYVIQTFGNGVSTVLEQLDYTNGAYVINDGTSNIKLAQSFIPDSATTATYFLAQIRRMRLDETGSVRFSVQTDSSGSPSGTSIGSEVINFSDNFFTDMKINLPHLRIISPTIVPYVATNTYWLVAEFTALTVNIVAWDIDPNGTGAKKSVGGTWSDIGGLHMGAYVGAGSLSLSHTARYEKQYNSVD